MIQIDFPFHGAVVSHRHGVQDSAGLTVEVRGSAPAWGRVTVNGVEARRCGAAFESSVTLAARESDVLAVWEGPSGRLEHTVRVVWDRNSRPRYRFSIDDNSFFLRDLVEQSYESLFECHYLAILKRLNEKYGAKFSLNCYYVTDDDPARPFRMPELSDRYKAEWRDNAHWLKLSFHAHANTPNRPYQHAAAEKLAEDFDKVRDEIIRFAGEDTWATPTVIHWAMATSDGLGALAERGVKVLSGMFRPRDGGYDIDYRLGATRSEYLSRRKLLKDFASGIVFSRGDITCNNVPLDEIASHMDQTEPECAEAEVRDLFTHEQYFWKFYSHYVPDHAERLDAAIRYVTERGYEPVFYHEGFLGIEE